MKRGIKNVLIFVSGAAVGSAVTTVALRAFYTKFINETLTAEVNKQMDEIKEEYNASLEKIKAKYEENLVKNAQNSLKKPENEQKPVQSEVKKKKTREEKQESAVDYTKYSEDKKKKVEKDEKTEAINENINDTTNDAGTYIISFGDYTEDNGYEKMTSTFYATDGVFTNDYDDPDPELPDIVGNLMEKFEDYGEGNSLYLRNDGRETDYEIIFDEGSYME